MREVLKPMVEAGLATCARRGQPISPDEPWELDHDDVDKRRYLGVSHQRGNRATLTHAREAAAMAAGLAERRWSRDW
jgi:hypothetical protein